MTLAPAATARAPDIRLYGTVDAAMLGDFLSQKAEAPAQGPILIELTTTGGDADIGRRLGAEVGDWQRQGRELTFVGRSSVYSAGVTMMAAFPRERRFLSADCELLIHERKLDKTLTLQGALGPCLALLRNVVAEIESGQRLQRAGFEALLAGSSVTIDALDARLRDRDWYVTADEARCLGLVAGVI